MASHKKNKKGRPSKKIIAPNSVPQSEFVASTAFECFYAGAAGSGKTMALLLSALKYIDNPEYTAIIFRRSWAELEKTVLVESKKIYPYIGGKYNKTTKTWQFFDTKGAPVGKIRFGYLDKEDDINQYLGLEVQFIGFDELVLFSEEQFHALAMRLRSSAGIPSRIRSTSNPYADWVFKRYNYWLNFDPHTEPHGRLKDGEIVRINGATRQVIFGRLADNVTLTTNDPDYEKRLQSRDRLNRERYLHNNWQAKPAPGTYFKRGWFETVDIAPADTVKIRSWDLAATVNGDYTASVLLGIKDGVYYVEHATLDKLTPEKVEDLLYNTAVQEGAKIMISIPRDPAQAGKYQMTNLAKLLAGYNVRFRSETGNKETKVQGISAQCEAGNVRIVRGAWNRDFLDQLEQFPEKTSHDDAVDAFAGAFNASLSIDAIKYRPWDRQPFTRAI